MIARLPLPPTPVVLVLMVAAFALPGLTVHDPWKPFDVIGIEIIHQMHVTGDWLVPRVAGESWLEDPPLFHWIALAFAKALGGLMQFHNAARLASGAFLLAAAWFLYRAGGALAPLMLIGCVGLIVHAHETVPDLATLAFACAALLVLVRGPANVLTHAPGQAHQRAPGKALTRGVWFGLAVGGAFLSTGFTNALALVATAIVAHLASPQLRNRDALPFLGAAIGVAVVLSASWPFALWLRSPALLELWWLTGARGYGDAASNLRYFLSTATWFAWPAWPLAAWAMWACRRKLHELQLLVPLAATLAMFTGIVLAGPAQDINATTLLAPLALLGAQGVPHLRRGAANALDWFGVMTFGFFAGLVWLGWYAMMTGEPARMANNFAKTAPGFVPQFDPVALAVAAALTLAWGALAFYSAPSEARSATRWAAGVALLWGVFSMLWMPWADHIKSYRPVALELKRHLPQGNACIAQRNFGVPQLAALSYHGGIVMRQFDPAQPVACRLLVVQGNPRMETDVPGRRWTRIAEAGRPGDKHERFRLYRFR
jgi:4-amino-4-deoxy-L-arabinose transferase-like glycosyltransferase